MGNSGAVTGFRFALRIMVVLAIFLGLLANPFFTQTVRGDVQPAQLNGVANQTVPTCKNRVNIPEEEMHWLYVPESSTELQTTLNYAFLAAQLIKNGAVDASACPAGGIGSDGYANACGLATANKLVVKLQNIYDEAILQAWEDVGVPPVLLKQMIRYESQFWPGTWEETHFGLAHATYFGAHTALSRRPGLYKEICQVTGDCSGTVTDAQIGTLLDLMNPICPSCPEKIDIPKAQKSIHYIAEMVYAYCEVTASTIFNATDLSSFLIVDYPTIWKLTLVSYNVGPMCVYDAVQKAYEFKGTKVDWDDIVLHIDEKACGRGIAYAEQITERFYDFPPNDQK
jgi:hypothetical protein